MEHQHQQVAGRGQLHQHQVQGQVGCQEEGVPRGLLHEATSLLLALGLGSLAGITGTFTAGFVCLAVAAGLAALSVHARERAWRSRRVEVAL